MSVCRIILGGIIGILAGALAVMADGGAPASVEVPRASGVPAMPVAAVMPSVRPRSRDEGQAMALGGVRPVSRPPAMVRFPVIVQTGATLRPIARTDLPETRWDHRPDADDWTRAVLSALNGQRHDLSDIVPRDIGTWCPAYADNPEPLRDAFWVGLISALARYESRHDPRAVGGGGQWYGLLQIGPPTARHFGCEATSGEALLNPTANLACTARIMTATVRRDRAVALHDGRWRGIAADWGPMTEPGMREEMAAWTRAQDYCVIRTPQLRPEARPAWLGTATASDRRPMLRPVARPARDWVAEPRPAAPDGPSEMARTLPPSGPATGPAALSRAL